jgi:hypothetical protein
LRTAVSGRRYANADFRVFEFDEEATKLKDGVFKLKEWKDTEEKGGGMGKSEKGNFPVLETDFPKEEVANEEPA